MEESVFSLALVGLPLNARNRSKAAEITLNAMPSPPRVDKTIVFSAPQASFLGVGPEEGGFEARSTNPRLATKLVSKQRDVKQASYRC